VISNNNNNNSVEFSSSLLTCQFCSQKDNYRNSTTQITTDSEQHTNEADATKTNEEKNI
jgi:hypothetical protein